MNPYLNTLGSMSVNPEGRRTRNINIFDIKLMKRRRQNGGEKETQAEIPNDQFSDGQISSRNKWS